MSELQPDIVFTHTGHDVHTDHKTAFEATREAARGACTILCYENPNTPPEFNPNYYIDIEGYLDDKIAALSLHRSQAGKDYTNPDVVRASASFRGNQARVKYAEAFESVRVLEKAAPV
jgi:LmbE family N-acetylglucosaminyl deacetylase